MALPVSGRRNPGPIDLAWGPVSERLMGTLLVVETEISRHARDQCWYPLVFLDIDVLVFHTPPQPLHEHVVQRPPTPVPAHRDPGLLQAAGVIPRRELGALIGVEDLRPAPRQRLVQRLQAE